jgi:hypothetical protein
MMFTFIADDCADLPIEACCRTMKVSRSAFFAWRQRRANPTPKMVDDIDLGELIVKIHDQSHGTYGAPRVTAESLVGTPPAAKTPLSSCQRSRWHSPAPATPPT